jgi:transcriptional regulator with XRE-family HTH domain
MVGRTKREDIRRRYRALRNDVGKTQIEVEHLARLDAGRFWKIENGVVWPTPDERKSIARVLRVEPSDLPAERTREEVAS